MGPCERPLTVAVFDSHLLWESICCPTVPKSEAALIPVKEPVPVWSFVCACAWASVTLVWLLRGRPKNWPTLEEPSERSHFKKNVNVWKKIKNCLMYWNGKHQLMNLEKNQVSFQQPVSPLSCTKAKKQKTSGLSTDCLIFQRKAWPSQEGSDTVTTFIWRFYGVGRRRTWRVLLRGGAADCPDRRAPTGPSDWRVADTHSWR